MSNLRLNLSQLNYLEQAMQVAQPFWFRVRRYVEWRVDDDVEEEAVVRAFMVFRQMVGDLTVPLELRVMAARMRNKLLNDGKQPAFILTRISDARGAPAASVRRLIDHYSYGSGFRSVWQNAHNEAITYLLATRTQFPAIIPQDAFNLYLTNIMIQTGREQVESGLCRCSLRLTNEPCAVCGYQVKESLSSW